MTKSIKINKMCFKIFFHSMDNHGGVILYLVEQLKYQEWKETVIAYAFLLRDGAMPENELDEVCEKFLRDLSAKGGKRREKKRVMW